MTYGEGSLGEESPWKREWALGGVGLKRGRMDKKIISLVNDSLTVPLGAFGLFEKRRGGHLIPHRRLAWALLSDIDTHHPVSVIAPGSLLFVVAFAGWSAKVGLTFPCVALDAHDVTVTVPLKTVLRHQARSGVLQGRAALAWRVPNDCFEGRLMGRNIFGLNCGRRGL